MVSLDYYLSTLGSLSIDFCSYTVYIHKTHMGAQEGLVSFPRLCMRALFSNGVTPWELFFLFFILKCSSAVCWVEFTREDRQSDESKEERGKRETSWLLHFQSTGLVTIYAVLDISYSALSIESRVIENFWRGRSTTAISWGRRE